MENKLWPVAINVLIQSSAKFLRQLLLLCESFHIEIQGNYFHCVQQVHGDCSNLIALISSIKYWALHLFIYLYIFNNEMYYTLLPNTTYALKAIALMPFKTIAEIQVRKKCSATLNFTESNGIIADFRLSVLK